DEMTDAGHIERALKAKATRTGRVSARILDDMLAGVILIDTAGAAVGKCNGLTVLEVGDSAFGVPARISATVYPGGSGIVDIEREVNLGQPIHSKGVMILTGDQGAIIPQANVATLMLDEKVLQAVRAGQFHIYAVRQADEALSLLVGEDAGEPDAEGQFPEGTVNARVVERLRAIAEMISEE